MWKILPPKVLAANPQLKDWNAQGIQAWATEKMQGAMEYVSNAGFIEGRKVGAKEAQIGLDEGMKLSKFVSDAEDRAKKEQEARIAKFDKMFNLAEPSKERDPAGYVLEESPIVQRMFSAAAEAGPDDAAEVWKEAIDTSIAEQMKLPGATERNVKALPIKVAKGLVQGFLEGNGPQATQKFYALKEQSGQHWDRVQNELVEQGLPITYQLLDDLDPIADAAAVNALGQTLNMKPEDLKADLADASIKEDILDPIDSGMAEYRQALEYGSASGIEHGHALMQAIKNVAVYNFRRTGNATQAIADAKAIVTDRYSVLDADNVKAIVPKVAGVSEDDIQAAARFMQDKRQIEAFDPRTIFGIGVSSRPDFWKDRTRSNIVNRGVWTNNATGDGLQLMVPLGPNGLAVEPVVNAKGERYEFKFADVPEIVRRSIYMPGIIAGGL